MKVAKLTSSAEIDLWQKELLRLWNNDFIGGDEDNFLFGFPLPYKKR
jgi:hypothetical protein